MSERLNVLLFMTDNQPAELLGCYGNDEIRTPHIDALAASGRTFDNAFCVNGMCSPCRASVMTGLMPSQHGIHTWIDDRLRDQWPDNWNAIGEFEALPQILANAGYQTALIGKYHLGAPETAQNGFQHWVTNPHGHVRDFWDGAYIVDGEEVAEPGHSVDFFTEKAIEYLASVAGDDTPFFAFVPYNAPYGHWPALKGRARNRFRADCDHADMHTVPREGLHPVALVRFLKKAADSYGGVDHSSELLIPNDLETLRNYYSEMAMVDDGVGRVLAALTDLGLGENTLVVYTADHGFSLGHHGIWGHSQATLPANAFRATFSIPLIFNMPGRIAAGRDDGLISQIDLFATLLELLDLPAKGHNTNSPSESFAATILEGTSGPRDAVFLEQEETRAIRTAEWLFKKRFPLAPTPPYPDELYDLVADPGERTNLADGTAYGDTTQGLSERIDAFFERYSVPAFDLWRGGAPKSKSDKPWLWKEAWGDDWEAGYGVG